MNENKLFKEKNNRKDRKLILFYIAYYPMVFCKGFGLNQSNAIYNKLFFAIIAILLLRFFSLKYLKRELIIVSTLVGVGLLTYINGAETTLLFTIVFLVCSKGIDFEKTIKNSMYLYFMGTVLKLILYYTGLYEGGSKVVNLVENGYSVTLEYSGYGFITPNVLYANVFLIILMFFYVYNEKMKLIHFVLSFFIMYKFYTMTHCRTGFLVYLCLLCSMLIFKYIKEQRFILELSMIVVQTVSFLIGIALPVLYNPSWSIFVTLNKILTGRFRLAKDAINNIGISLFGKTGCSLDILYMNVLIRDGLCGFIITLAAIVMLFISLRQSKNMMGYICMTLMTLYASIEQFPMNIAMNPFLLLIGVNIIYKCNRKGGSSFKYGTCWVETPEKTEELQEMLGSLEENPRKKGEPICATPHLGEELLEKPEI